MYVNHVSVFYIQTLQMRNTVPMAPQSNQLFEKNIFKVFLIGEDFIFP